MISKRSRLYILMLSALAANLGASPVTVTSYTMLNGASSSFDYRDFSYTPCNAVCDVTGSSLSGGIGKLSDGVVPSLDWYQEGQNTSWVGWDSLQGLGNPTVVFNFGQLETITSMTIWASNSRTGGVALPGSIVVNGNVFLVAPDPLNTLPQGLIISGLDLTGSSVSVQMNQAAGFNWVMIGEVSFDGSAVTPAPEPGTVYLLGSALAACLCLRFLRGSLRPTM